MVSARIIERKLRSTKVRLFTVPCCSIILFSSEGVKKKYLNFYEIVDCPLLCLIFQVVPVPWKAIFFRGFLLGWDDLWDSVRIWPES